MPNRGLTFWSDAGGRDQRLFVAVRQYLYALDAKTGTPVADFGQAGRIDLRDGLGRTQKDMVSLSRIGRTVRPGKAGQRELEVAMPS